MAIVIAILLALILVAMMYSSKDASKGVLGVIKGALIASLILLIWLVIIGYCTIYYSLYTDKEWYGLAGIAAACLLPPVLMWLGRDELKAFLKQDDQKRVFKYLILYLLGAIAVAAIGITYQEYKKTNPYIAYQILPVIIGITGFILYRRSQMLPRGWRDIFTEDDSKDLAYFDFNVSNRDENRHFAYISESFATISADEVERLKNKHLANLASFKEALDKRIANIEKIRSFASDFIYQAFIYSCMFFAITLAIDLWGWAYDFALTIDFVAGRPLWAGGLVIAVVIGLCTIGSDLYQKFKDK